MCPGYDDVFKHLLRDETFKMSKRIAKAVLPHQPTSRHMKTGEANVHMVPKQTIRITRAVFPSVEALALDFFFLNYSINQDSQDTRGFLELLPVLYSRSSHSSPLVMATTAFAVNVYSLWGLERSDFLTARRLYQEAIVKTKEALLDCVQLNSDDVLLATLILEAYESLDSSFQGSCRKGLHAAGSVALIKHRAARAGNDEVFGQIVTAVQSKLIRDKLEDMNNIGRLVDVWQAGVAIKQTPAAQADRLAFQFLQLKNRLRLCKRDTDYATILKKAITLWDECTRWLENIPNHWHPVSVSTDSIDESLKKAGVYDTWCDVYANLSIANIQNWHRIIEIRVLHLIRQCLDRNMGLNDSLRGHLVCCVTQRAQVIVDKICASLPYHAGNITQAITPLLSDKVHFPQASMSDSTGFQHQSYPDSESQHARQIVSSGMWMIYGTLTDLITEIEPGCGASMLRCFDISPGQLEWIRSQILRLKRVFFLSNRLHVGQCF